MADNNLEGKRRGIPLRLIYVAFIVLVIVISAILFFELFETASSYSEFREATEKYLASERDATALKQGSDYLTEQVRLFAVTGERVYLDNYFTEAKVTKSRDNALENLEKFLDGTQEYRYLSAALDYSNRLMEQEYCSMKLRALSVGMDMSSLPSEVVHAEIGARDAGLDADGQRDRAIAIVFSDLYSSYKANINDNISKSINKLTERNRDEQIVRSEKLFSNLRVQSVLIVIASVIMLGMMILTSSLVIRPMIKAMRYIKADKKIPVSGSDEMRILAQTYNEMYENNVQKNLALSFAANHDGLTGLFNRTAYLHALSEAGWTDVAVLAVDVDSFKQINDRFGHAAGDKALISVAKALSTSFRADDFICRIGGDEFTVIMKHSGASLRKLIKEKIERAMDIVAHPEDEDTPPLTISVGVAFGDWSTEADKIANKADIALYKVKNEGKNGCAFYDDIDPLKVKRTKEE